MRKPKKANSDKYFDVRITFKKALITKYCAKINTEQHGEFVIYLFKF